MTVTTEAPPEAPQLTRQQRINMERLARLIEKISTLEGKKRRGKTLSGVGICWNLREIFGLPIVVVGSKMGLKEEFGPVTYLSEKKLINELEKINEVVNMTDEELEESLETVLAKMGVNIYGCVMVIDEAYKLFDCRTPSDKLVRVFGYLMAQSAHYHLTVFLLVPFHEMLDKRVRFQVDWRGKCFYNKRTKWCTVRFVQGLEYWPLYVYGPNHFDKFDSWVLLGMRQKHLEIAGL